MRPDVRTPTLPERLARLLPPRLLLGLGARLGWWAAHLPLRDVRRAREHLATAFPGVAAGWTAACARRAFAAAGAMAGFTLAALGRDGVWARRHLMVDQPDRLRALARHLRRGRGAVAFTGHLGNWELLARAVGAALPLTVVGRRLRTPAADALIRTLRTATGARQVDQDADARVLIGELRRGRLVGILNDQDIPRLAGGFVPWFGVPAWTPLAPGALAVQAGAWCTAACYRRHGRWRLHLGPLHALARDGRRGDAALAVVVAATAEWQALVERLPGQWAWWHKRWRTRPPGPAP